MSGKRKSLVVGITGGVGSGKTTVARMFNRLGAKVISADAIAHKVLNRDEIKKQIVKIWGSDVISPSGEIDRSRLAEMVFTKKEELKTLEAIVHPPVIREIEREIERASSDKVVIVDAPLLLEAGLERLCERIIFVEAKRENRLLRLRRERGWDERELLRRQSHQKPLNLKREKADDVINNDQNFEHTFRQVKGIWERLGASSPPLFTSASRKKHKVQEEVEVSNMLRKKDDTIHEGGNERK